MNSNYNYEPITLDMLYRNYIDYMRNSNRILNNTISIVYNQQQTFNEIISHYNNVSHTNIISRPNFRYRPVRPSPLAHNSRFYNIARGLFDINNNNNSENIPSISDLNNSIRFIIYSNIDISTNTTCPITQRDFNPNDIVAMINGCNHIYDPGS